MAKRIESLLTASRTGLLEEKMIPISLCKITIIRQKTSPIIVDVVTETIVANFAPFPFPAPSSFATLTLHSYHSSPEYYRTENT